MNKGHFQKGNKLGKGGKRPGAGRPSNQEIAKRESLRQALERIREERASILSDKYFDMAMEDPATMRHVVDKVMPDLDATPPAPGIIQFIQFNADSPLLPAKETPITIKQPASKENQLLEPQGQDGIKFLDFTKRRQ